MDPSRHVHPGIPYDFYSGYVVVESLNLDDGGQSRRQEETVVLGQLPQVVRAKLEEQWGKYQYVNDNKVVYVYVIYVCHRSLYFLSTISYLFLPPPEQRGLNAFGQGPGG